MQRKGASKTKFSLTDFVNDYGKILFVAIINCTNFVNCQYYIFVVAVVV